MYIIGGITINELEYQLHLRTLASECADQYFDMFLYGFKNKGKTSIQNFLLEEEGILDYPKDEFYSNLTYELMEILQPINYLSMTDKEVSLHVYKTYLKDFRRAVGIQLMERLEHEAKSENEYINFLEKSLEGYSLLKDKKLMTSDTKQIKDMRDHIFKINKAVEKYRERLENYEKGAIER